LSIASAVVLLDAASRGRLPAWAQASPKRSRLRARVAALLGEWAARAGLPAAEQARCRATGWLHDALRDADGATLRPLVDSPFRDLPDGFLHGPAAAARLEAEGVDDAELLEAVRYHTLGRPGLGRLGRLLMVADYLEPGRPQHPGWRAMLRARMPEALDDVFAAVIQRRMRAGLERRHPIRPEMMAMWNELVERDGAEG
jgi:HD superfamily phosphohydrolase YqeK